MAGEQIWVVEDEAKIAHLLRDYLIQAGYRVTCLDRGDRVMKEMEKEVPALILLDLMLPEMDGIEICREVRKKSNVPIIMVTARVEEVDRLIGLEVGADDYVCKPFNPREVVARVRAVLRRAHPQAPPRRLYAGPFALDEDAHRVSVSGEDLDLTPNEFALLKALMSHPGRVFRRQELLDQVQGYTYEGYDRTIDTHVKNLRKKIAAKLGEQEVIRTVYGVGYTLALPSADERPCARPSKSFLLHNG
jgi:two-component system response regulator BaeR